jgi:hypothetical protein
MVKRIALVVAVAALATPTAALAGDGKSGSGRDLTSKVAQLRSDLDKRFDKFASQCLVSGAPERCPKAAGRFLTGLDALEARVEKIRSRIDERCSGANPPKRCAQRNGLLVQLDHLAEAANEYQGQIEAAFPNAGHAAEGE